MREFKNEDRSKPEERLAELRAADDEGEADRLPKRTEIRLFFCGHPARRRRPESICQVGARRGRTQHADRCTEAEYVVSIIQTLWQLRRANLIDTELFAMYRFYEKEKRGVGTAFAQDAGQTNSFSKLIRYQAHLVRKLALLKKELGELQQRRSLVMITGSPPLEQQPPANGELK